MLLFRALVSREHFVLSIQVRPTDTPMASCLSPELLGIPK